MIHTTTIQGIPCQVDVRVYPGSSGGRERGGMQIEPDEDASVEIIEVLDRKGYKASWLDKKMTKIDMQRIANEVLGE